MQTQHHSRIGDDNVDDHHLFVKNKLINALREKRKSESLMRKCRSFSTFV